VFSDNQYMMHLLFLPSGTDPKLADLLRPILWKTVPIFIVLKTVSM